MSNDKYGWKENAIRHHQKMFALVKKNESRPHEEIIYAVLELCGEAGELANVLKKFMRGDKSVINPDDVQSIIDEIADVRICTELVASTLDIDLDKACNQKVVKNMDKWAMKDMGVKEK